jgi:hypothetical protein
MTPTLILIRPLTAEVGQWLNANIEYQLVVDGSIPIDHEHIDAVLAGLEEAGFEEGTDYEVVR